MPKRLAGAFDYHPDHLLLVLQPQTNQPPVAALRIDYKLFVGLERLSNGLPRHLIPDREVNRLDALVEELRRPGVQHSNKIYVHSHADHSTAEISLAFDYSSYQEVLKHD